MNTIPIRSDMSNDNDQYDDGKVLIAGVLYDEETLEEVDFCGCTNEELEAGRTCGEDTCPNRPVVR